MIARSCSVFKGFRKILAEGFINIDADRHISHRFQLCGDADTLIKILNKKTIECGISCD